MKKRMEGSRRRESGLALALAWALFATSALAAPPGEKLDGVVNVNTANIEQLQQLPGVGETRARAILGVRKERGGFRSIDELTDVRGVGEALLRKLRPYVTLKGKTTLERR